MMLPEQIIKLCKSIDIMITGRQELFKYLNKFKTIIIRGNYSGFAECNRNLYVIFWELTNLLDKFMIYKLSEYLHIPTDIIYEYKRYLQYSSAEEYNFSNYFDVKKSLFFVNKINYYLFEDYLLQLGLGECSNQYIKDLSADSIEELNFNIASDMLECFIITKDKITIFRSKANIGKNFKHST